MLQEKDKKSTPDVQLNISSVPPSLAVDGSGIKIFPERFAEIVFFQTIEQKKNLINARGVCNVRMSIEQLKNFKTTIDAVLKKHEEDSKAKK